MGLLQEPTIHIEIDSWYAEIQWNDEPWRASKHGLENEQRCEQDMLLFVIVDNVADGTDRIHLSHDP